MDPKIIKQYQIAVSDPLWQLSSDATKQQTNVPRAPSSPRHLFRTVLLKEASPVGEGKVRATLVICRRVALDFRVRADAVVDPEGNKSDAIGMFLDEKELLRTIAKFRQFLREQQNRRRIPPVARTAT